MIRFVLCILLLLCSCSSNTETPCSPCSGGVCPQQDEKIQVIEPEEKGWYRL